MDESTLKYKKIVFVYEFVTPNGILPYGYNKNTISINFINHLKINTNYREGIFLSNEYNPNDYKIEYPIFVQDLVEVSKNLDRKLISDLNDINSETLYIIPFESTNVCPLFEQYGMDDMKLEDYFTPKTLEFILKYDNFKILFMDNREGGYYHNPTMITNIQNFLNKFKIVSKNKIVVSTNNNKILDFKSIDDRINFYNNKFYIYKSGWFISEIQTSNLLIKSDEYVHSLNDNFDYSKKEKLFLMYNRNTSRYHRPFFVNELYKNNLINHGNISLFKNLDFENFIKESRDIDELNITKDLFIDLQNNYNNFYPSYIDNNNAEEVANYHNYLSRKDEYETSWFTIISETNAESNCCFITEKTTKPIMNLHPFFILGNPFSLKFLKEIGFKTFSEFWDESYDNEINFVIRVEKIINEIKKLSNLSKNELEIMFIKMESILIYNKKLLHTFSRKNYLKKELFEIYN